MKFNLTKKSLIIGAVLLLTGATFAFARGGYWGNGYGGHMMGYGSGYSMGPGMMGYGYGMGPGMMGYGPGYSDNGPWYGSNLSKAQQSKLDASQEKFYNDTRELRGKIQDQRNALQQELAADNPDSAKVTKLQQGLSALESELDQKVVEHQLELRKIAPDNFDGGGYGPGYGGYCW